MVSVAKTNNSNNQKEFIHSLLQSTPYESPLFQQVENFGIKINDQSTSTDEPLITYPKLLEIFQQVTTSFIEAYATLVNLDNAESQNLIEKIKKEIEAWFNSERDYLLPLDADNNSLINGKKAIPPEQVNLVKILRKKFTKLLEGNLIEQFIRDVHDRLDRGSRLTKQRKLELLLAIREQENKQLTAAGRPGYITLSDSLLVGEFPCSSHETKTTPVSYDRRASAGPANFVVRVMKDASSQQSPTLFFRTASLVPMNDEKHSRLSGTIKNLTIYAQSIFHACLDLDQSFLGTGTREDPYVINVDQYSLLSTLNRLFDRHDSQHASAQTSILFNAIQEFNKQNIISVDRNNESIYAKINFNLATMGINEGRHVPSLLAHEINNKFSDEFITAAVAHIQHHLNTCYPENESQFESVNKLKKLFAKPNFNPKQNLNQLKKLLLDHHVELNNPNASLEQKKLYSEMYALHAFFALGSYKNKILDLSADLVSFISFQNLNFKTYLFLKQSYGAYLSQAMGHVVAVNCQDGEDRTSMMSLFVTQFIQSSKTTGFIPDYQDSKQLKSLHNAISEMQKHDPALENTKINGRGAFGFQVKSLPAHILDPILIETAKIAKAPVHRVDKVTHTEKSIKTFVRNTLGSLELHPAKLNNAQPSPPSAQNKREFCFITPEQLNNQKSHHKSSRAKQEKRAKQAKQAEQYCITFITLFVTFFGIAAFTQAVAKFGGFNGNNFNSTQIGSKSNSVDDNNKKEKNTKTENTQSSNAKINYTLKNQNKSAAKRPRSQTVSSAPSNPRKRPVQSNSVSAKYIVQHTYLRQSRSPKDLSQQLEYNYSNDATRDLRF